MVQEQGRTLAELLEADARGRIKEIYAELRRLSGVPIVALIFRHLATHVGLLDHIWLAVRPLMANGLLQDAAARVASENTPQGLIPPIDANVRSAIDLDADRVGPIVNAVEAYNRANAINLLVMLSLLQRVRLDRSLQQQLVPARVCRPPAPIAGPLSRMMSPSDMPPHIRRLINDLGFGNRTQLDPVVPSLLRHLCDAPGLLAVLHVILVPQFKDGTLRQVVARLKSAMTHEATTLAPYIAPLPQLMATPSALTVMEEFTDSWIPQMTVIGFALKRALGDV